MKKSLLIIFILSAIGMIIVSFSISQNPLVTSEPGVDPSTMRHGNTLPTNCNIGDQFTKLNSTLGHKMYLAVDGGYQVPCTWEEQGNGAPGFISFISSGSCPSGYSEVVGANGRFPIGTLAVNGNVGTVGSQVGQSGTGLTLNFVRVIACKKD